MPKKIDYDVACDKISQEFHREENDRAFHDPTPRDLPRPPLHPSPRTRLPAPERA